MEVVFVDNNSDVNSDASMTMMMLIMMVIHCFTTEAHTYLISSKWTVHMDG